MGHPSEALIALDLSVPGMGQRGFRRATRITGALRLDFAQLCDARLFCRKALGVLTRPRTRRRFCLCRRTFVRCCRRLFVCNARG